jgi:hypothetical protein
MEWSKTQQMRLQVERQLLAHYFPGFGWKHPSDPQQTTIEGVLQTNPHNLYGIRLYMPSQYPNWRPDAVIVSPSSLKGYKGRDLKTINAAMHLLNPRDGYIRLCLYRDWIPNTTLYAVVFKARLWLEALEAHQRTGLPIDHYLRHA